MLHLFNTLTNKKEVFEPLDPKTVRMYNCGPTVYNHVHIGNLRSYVFADILRRTLEAEGYSVQQVINITDVGHLTDDEDRGEDKVEAQAKKENRTAEEITRAYTDAFFHDLELLHIKTDQTKFPRATDHIQEQINLIKTLEDKGYTYQTSDGIYFDTSRFPEYGKLGQIDLSGIKEGARVEYTEEKRNPTDFALWKFSPKDHKRQQEWESPWGTGFPGWHIECSAMAMTYLGETFDIHTGGIDHIPVHHNNEIAQSECATGKPLARFWLHNEHVTLKGEKMAKSTGNIITLQTLIDRGFHPLAYKYWLLTAHYRTPMTFDDEALEGSQKALERLAHIYHNLPDGGTLPDTREKTLLGYLEDDLNTPSLIAFLWETVREDAISDAEKRALIDRVIDLLGIPLTDFGIRYISPGDASAEVAALIRDREAAREKKDFETADKIREKIQSAGYDIHDTDDGPQLTLRD